MKRSQEEHLRKDLKAIVGDGVTFSVMVGAGEAYIPAFVLAVGHGEVMAGLVATLPMLVGAMCQLVTPAGVLWLRSNKRWVVACAILQATSFLPLAGAALAGHISRLAVLVTTSLYWAFGMSTTAAWNTWVGTLVPPDRRARFFATRSQWCQAAVVAGLLGGGALLHAGSASSRPTSVFALLFGVAAAARLASSLYLSAQSEAQTPVLPAAGCGFSWQTGRLVARGAGCLLPFLLWMQASVYIAAPFFTPYMLVQLHLSYAAFTILTAAAFVSRIAALPLLGFLAHRFGTRRLMLVGAAGIVPLPALWLLSNSVIYLLALQCLAGSVWASFELATLLAFFERIPERERTSVLTSFNLANALAIAAGSVIGSSALGLCGSGAGGYAVLFVLSTVLRATGLATLGRRIPDFAPAAGPLSLRTLTVRPSAGAIQRLVLPAVPEGPEAHGRTEGG
jgi:MFS family permease